MKRTKVIALVLCAAIMLMGAGYAAWTDQLTITNTVKTGHLDLYFLDEETVTPAAYTTGSVSYGADEEAGEGPSDLDKAVVSLQNMYPGAETAVQLKVQNRSTMPVVFDAIAFDGTDYNYFTFPLITVTYTDNNNVTSTANVNAFITNKPQIKEGSVVTIDYKIVAKDNVSEDTTYSFTVKPSVKQFNQ